MGLPLAIDDSSLLTLLVADARTAWDLDGDHVFVDVPEAPAGRGDLPRAVIEMSEANFGGSSGSASCYAASFSNSITFQGLKSGDDTSLRSAKQARANELLTLLTARSNYHGRVWFPQNVTVTFGNGALEAGDGYYTVTVRFDCEEYG